LEGDLVLKWLEDSSDEFIRASDAIWNFAEVGLQENKSAALLEALLAGHGFHVEASVAGMPSAFVATWGRGTPVIGYLGEYDALPGLSQKVSPVRDPVKWAAPGHGCGHNLLGVGAAAAAIGLAKELEARGIPGTVKYFGCPAEELLTGKVYMAAEGIYDGTDVAITWHPGAINAVRMGSSNAMNSVKFTFHGQTAHAAADPHNGRSALDACILMDAAVNYLREHVIQDARMHSVITNGGGEPNVVPALAQIWYYIRAPKRKFVDEIYARVLKIAEAASMMTDTTYDVEFLTGCHDRIRLESLAGVLHRGLLRAGPPKFTEEEKAFAKEVAKSFPPGQKEKAMMSSRLPANLMDVDLHEEIAEPAGRGEIGHGSSDVGDVSYVCPTAEISTCCQVLGSPGHSWQFAATSGMGIGHKGMMAAAKAMALAGLELFTNQAVREEAGREWEAIIAKNPYKNPIPKGKKPDLDVVKSH
jgi:aminobenzoyl-glutamate utilization protein B